MASITFTCKELCRFSSNHIRRNGPSRGFRIYSRAFEASSSTAPASSVEGAATAKATKQTYPLYPSVAQLLHQNGIPLSEADKIPATGPKGRLLKGDVLAHLGSIQSSYSSEQSARISKLGRMDLSNVKIAAPAKSDVPTSLPDSATPLADVEADTEIAVTISFKAVKEVQERIHKMLGVTIPLETFVARAVELSNTDLPRPKDYQPTGDELFNQVLGLDKVTSKLSHGSFSPQIVALPAIPGSMVMPSSRRPDIIDALTAKNTSELAQNVGTAPLSSSTGSAGGSGVNVFSVTALKGEEQRAKVFLERIKTVLQINPGRLVL